MANVAESQNEKNSILKYGRSTTEKIQHMRLKWTIAGTIQLCVEKL